MLKLLREGSTLALTLAAVTTPVAAQRVGARVVVARGPVVADVRLGSTYAPPYHEVLVTRYVDRDDYLRRAPRWHRAADFHRVVIYVDRDGRYYDRWNARLIGLRTVVVYERDGRYYQDDGRFRDDDHRDRGDHDRGWRD